METPSPSGSALRAQFRETPRGVKALETFGDLCGVKRFTLLLGHGAGEILELKISSRIRDEGSVTGRPQREGAV